MLAGPAGVPAVNASDVLLAGPDGVRLADDDQSRPLAPVPAVNEHATEAPIASEPEAGLQVADEAVVLIV